MGLVAPIYGIGTSMKIPPVETTAMTWRYQSHIFLAYFSGYIFGRNKTGLNFREDPQKIWPEMWEYQRSSILGS